MILKAVITVPVSTDVSVFTGCHNARELNAGSRELSAEVTVLKVKVCITVCMLCCKARRLLMSLMNQINCRGP